MVPEPPSTTTSVDASTTSSTTPTTTTTTNPSTTTTTAPITTTTAALTTTAAAPACEVVAHPIPPDATELQAIDADVDGDGTHDVVTGYVSQGGSYLHVGLATGLGMSLRVDELFSDPGPIPMSRPVGVVEMSGDRVIMAEGRAILVGVQYVFVAFRDCALQPASLIGGGMPEIWTGGGANHADWFTCGPDGVVMREFSLDDPVADPQIYTGATANAFSYQPPSFHELGVVDPGVSFPISRPDLLAALPPCAA
jgi:hypothetical protein